MKPYYRDDLRAQVQGLSSLVSSAPQPRAYSHVQVVP